MGDVGDDADDVGKASDAASDAAGAAAAAGERPYDDGDDDEPAGPPPRARSYSAGAVQLPEPAAEGSATARPAAPRSAPPANAGGCCFGVCGPRGQ